MIDLSEKNVNKILEDLMDLSRQSYYTNFNCHNHDIGEWLRECATIKCCTSRTTGHTTALINQANKINHSVIICPRRQMLCLYSGVDDNVHVELIDNIFYSLRGKQFNSVFVDCSYLLDNKQIEEIYKLSIGNANRRLIDEGQPFYIVFMQ